MNELIEQLQQNMWNDVRTLIKEGLKNLPEKNFSLFKRMYSPNNPEWGIDQVVDNMPVSELDWAFTQIQNTLIKKKKEDLK